MNVFKKIERGLRKVKDKVVDDIIPNEFKSGEKMKKTIRNLIPNELADIAVKAAPFVAMIPGQQGTAALMRGLGRFDQRGSISDALKQAGATYIGGKVISPYTGNIIPGLEGNTYKGLEGLMQAGKDIGTGTMDLFKGGKNKAVDILGKGKEAFGSADDVYPGMETGSGAVKDKGIMSTIFDKGMDMGKEYLFGKDKKFQMGDIGRFLGDPGKTIPLTMIATYIKEKFFPDEDQDSFDAKFAEAMAKRGENVSSYLKRSGPFDPRRDPTKNPYTQDEIDQFADDLTIEYRNVAADGGIMSVPRENYFLGSLKPKRKVITINPNPDFEKASKVTPDDIMDVFKKKFDGGVFVKGRSPAEGPRPLGLIPPDAGRIPKASKVSSDDILNVFKEKFDEGDFSFSSPRLALPMGRRVSATFSPKQALTAERAFDVDETGREIRDFFERRLTEIPASFRPEIMENEEIIELLNEGDRKGLDALMTSLLRDANFDRLTAAMGGRMEYARGGDTPEENAMQAAGIEGLDLNINPKGVTELDMRETGGFIPPVGVKEKEDDIPAMLSNNEFVFTADAVRGMGDGDVDKGAERMYSMMKKLEDGGRV